MNSTSSQPETAAALKPPAATSHGADSPSPELRRVARRMAWGLVFGVPLVAAGVTDALTPGRPLSAAIGDRTFLLLRAALCTLLMFACAGPFLIRAWRSIRTRRPTLDTLVGLSAGAAFVYSLVAAAYSWSGINPLPHAAAVEIQPELLSGVQAVAPDRRGMVEPFFESAGMVVLLALVGQFFELRSRERSGAALRKLAPLAPRTARVLLPGGGEEERPVEAVRPGDLIRVRPGERIPADGVIRDGTSTLDESMLTGEATRAERGPGGRVLAGSENGLRPITVEAVQVGRDTVIDQVIELVGRARERRAALQLTADRALAWYVPAVLLAAAATFAGWLALGPDESALTAASVCAVGVLVVACPCAVGLATSAVVVVAMRRAAGAGILFRDAAALEALAAVDTVLFDKTGTLTRGKPRLAAVVPNAGFSENAVLALAAAVERGSEHPLGLAIVWEAARRGLGIVAAGGVEAVVGKGVRGTVGGARVSVGRLGFLQESGVYADLMLSEAQAHRGMGRVVVFVGEGRRVAGLIAMDDPVRAGAKAAVERLRADGLKVLVVTGDHEDTARGVARGLGIDGVVSDALPVEKFAVVRKLKGEGRTVAMCGDGVNDAPALVAADVGVALASGTGAAIGTAGVTLARSELEAVPAARDLSRAAVRTIRQNLVFAFAFNVLAIPVAAGALVPLGGGLINSAWASVAMILGALAVLANALRLSFRRVGSAPPAPAGGH